MLTLFSYPTLFGVADNNGYGLKVFAFLKLAGVPFRHEHIFDASKAPRGQLPYSHITLHLRPRLVSVPPIDPIEGWDPVRTFQNAFAVFVRIFGFMVDILIWITVVLGPFILVTWLGFLLVRRITTGKKASEGERTEAE